MENTKAYLGDSVYAEMDQWSCIVLTTEDGFGPSNRIVLDPQVYITLLDWFKELTNKPEAKREH